MTTLIITPLILGLSQPSEITNACPAFKSTYNEKCKDVNGTCGAGSVAVGPALDHLAWLSVVGKDAAVTDFPALYVTDPLAALNYFHSDAYAPPPASECAWGRTDMCIPKNEVEVMKWTIYDMWSYGGVALPEDQRPPQTLKKNAGAYFIHMDKDGVIWDDSIFMNYPGFGDAAYRMRIISYHALTDKMFTPTGSVVADPGCTTTVGEVSEEHWLVLWFERKCANKPPVVGQTQNTHFGWYKFEGDRFNPTWAIATLDGETPEMRAAFAHKLAHPLTKFYTDTFNTGPPFGGLSDLLCEECEICANKCRYSAATNATYKAWQASHQALVASYS
jgi:hypothetical protein